jgi:branched-chain amino acid transport system permease protein
MSKSIFSRHRFIVAVIFAGFIFMWLMPRYNLLNPYIQQVLMYIGINIILAESLNLVNGFMGEFSVGHAGFMSIGAYVASIITVKLIPASMQAVAFPFAVIAGGLAAAVVGFFIAIPSFKIRGDYLAIVTLAFLMIVKSVIENIDAIGAARGFLGMDRLTTPAWVFFWTVLTVWVIRNFIYSSFGRGMLSIREDEIACELMSVNTRKVKVIVFAVSAFFAGVGGGLFAHLIQYINPGMFDIMKSTEILIMIYLGGVGSITGGIFGATTYTLMLELFRPLGIWRVVILPFLFLILMINRPRGIIGTKELPWFFPRTDRRVHVRESE